MPSMPFLSKAPSTDTGAYFNSLWTNVALYEASIGLTDTPALPFDFGNGSIVGLPPDQQSCLTPIPSMYGVIAPTNCPDFCGETFQNFQWNEFLAGQAFEADAITQSSNVLCSLDRNTATFTPTVSTPAADSTLMQCYPGGLSHFPSDEVSRRQRQSHPEFSPLPNDESPPHIRAPSSPDRRPETRGSDKPGRRAGVPKRSAPSTRSKGVAASGSQADGSNARERNRLAASGYRKRVKKHAEQLKLTNKDTEKLLAERDELAREVVQLKDQLLLHATCQDSNIDAWIARAAESYTQKLSLDR
ncbi:hypothetical protein E4U35_007370 [Claviceps purpurea]|nr:hypothetical protein E4U37_005619 [Claviceps purpurea]KAG6182375.1 hypothetical protein E4U10_007016 [Claviceps purpurea]KAG6185437.1 hypothetical protein E4U36_001332 [Claviceps purpurea]KAG6209298.1 hypothetical protein E4U35_007370 [Claviceps purpurea]KAG6240427.1 hypothetical protein E4U25_007991 [Claviceps purpurea]